jgi:hypothetical protein
VTFPRFRSRRRELALAGDFPDTGKTFPELLRDVQPGDWHAAPAFTGASSAGQPDGGADAAAGLRQAIELTAMAERDAPPTAPLRAVPPAARYAPPSADAACPACHRYVCICGEPKSAPQPDPRDTAPMQRLPRVERLRARPRPQRDPDAAMFAWSDLLSQHIMLCGACPPERRSRYADPIAVRMPFAFEALRQSAYVMGWRLDAFGLWACPACQLTARYHTPRPVILWDPDAIEAAAAGDLHAEYWHRAAAEHDLITDVADTAGNGKHRAGTR